MEETDISIRSMDQQQKSRGMSDISTYTTESFIIDDNDDTPGNNNDINTRHDDSCEECLKLSHEENNAFYLVDIRKGDQLQKMVDEKRSKDELQRRKYMFSEEYSEKKNARKWKFMSYLLIVVIVVMLFAFLWEFVQIQEIKTKLKMMQIEPEAPKRSMFKSSQKFSRHLPPKRFTALSLTGNGQVVMGRKGIPILNWRLHFKHGAIDFLEGKKIRIKKSGLYQLYAQMFFYKNAEMYVGRNTSHNPVMDFGITKIHTNERVIAATVALNSCEVACTRHISSFVSLQDGEILVVDTATPGVYFKMIAEKTLFGAYLVSDVQTKREAGFPP